MEALPVGPFPATEGPQGGRNGASPMCQECAADELEDSASGGLAKLGAKAVEDN